MNKLKRFKIGLFTITLGSVLVCTSFVMAAEPAEAGQNITPEEKAAQEAILAPVEPLETSTLILPLPEETKPSAAFQGPSEALSETETVPEPDPEPEPEWIEGTATAYCPCEKCCGVWTENRPNGIVYTASGAEAVQGVTIAADWSIYPPGTVLFVEGLGEMIVQDRGGAISGQKIDVFFNNHEDALHFGRQEVRIKVISDTER